MSHTTWVIFLVSSAIIAIWLALQWLSVRKLLALMDHWLSGNILIQYKGSSPSFIGVIGQKLNLLLRNFTSQTEIIENKLQDKNILMHQYTQLFLSLPTVYTHDELMKLILEYSSKIFRVETVLYIRQTAQLPEAVVYQTLQNDQPRLYVSPIDTMIHFKKWDQPVLKNVPLFEDEEWVLSDKFPAPRNFLQIPVFIKDSVIAILLLQNRENNLDFDETDLELGRTISMALSNQIKIISIIQEEKESTRKLEAIIDNISDAIMLTDQSQKIVLENPAARDLFSLNPIKKSLLIHEILKASSNSAVNLVLFKPERVVLLGRISTILNSEGLVDQYILSFRNATDSKQKEREKSEILFLTATKMYHPLLFIKKTKELFTFSSDPTLEAQLSAHINLAFDLINKLIFYTEIDAGPMRLAKRPTNINHIIDRVLDSLGATLKEQKFNIILHTDQSMGNYLLDADRIEQSISTILSFIIKISDDHFSLKTITLFSSTSSNEALVVTILHNNYQFEATELFELTSKATQLEKFMQSDQALEDLNLQFAFVKHVIHSHGGNFVVSSEPATGTTYRMELPIL